MKEKKVLRHNSSILTPVYYDEHGYCWLKLVLPGVDEASKPITIFHKVIFNIGDSIQIVDSYFEVFDSDLMSIVLDNDSILLAEQVEEYHDLE